MAKVEADSLFPRGIIYVQLLEWRLSNPLVICNNNIQRHKTLTFVKTLKKLVNILN